MRKIIAATFISLDGIMQAPGGPEEDPTGGFRFGGWVAPHFDEVLGEHLGETFGKPYELLLGRKTAMERVATFLLEMDRRLAKTGMIALPMCRRDIGDYLGLTLETVSRALSELQQQGVLGLSGARQIVLRNRDRLADLEA